MYALIFLLVLFIPIESQSKVDWGYIGKSEDIKIWMKSSKNSSLYGIKTDGYIELLNNRSPLAILSFDHSLRAISHFVEDFTGKMKFEVIKSEGPLVWYVYHHVDVPWPMKARDGVYRMDINFFTDKSSRPGVNIVFNSVKGLVAPKRGKLRMDVNGNVSLLKEKNGNIHVKTDGFSDIRANVPQWIVNQVKKEMGKNKKPTKKKLEQRRIIKLQLDRHGRKMKGKEIKFLHDRYKLMAGTDYNKQLFEQVVKTNSRLIDQLNQ